MMRRIVATSMRARGLVIIAAVVVMVLGVTQFRSMPRDVLPEFGPPTVEVQTEALGLAAEEVEQLITVPLEQDLLNGVAFLDEIRSQSVPSLSRIELVFEKGTNLARARQVVNERLTQAAALPHVSAPPQMLQPLASESRVMMIRLSSASSSLTDLGVLARWTIRPRLMGVPGVADVAVWGQRERQIQVQVDPAKLRDEAVSLEQVISTTGNALWWSPLGRLEANTPGTGGFVDGPQQRLGVLHESPIKTPADLSSVTLESSGEPGGPPPSPGSALTLGDVTTLVADHQPLIGDAVFGDGTGLLLVVQKLPDANVADVTDEVDAALEALQPGLNGVTVDASLFRPARYVDASIRNVVIALAIGLALLVAISLVVLFEWRTALILLATTVLTLLASVLVLGVRGAGLNTMVLAGLVLALPVAVDEAVVVSIAVHRRLRQRHLDDHVDPSLPAVVESTVDTRHPVVYATLMFLLAALAVAALHGETGAFVPTIVHAFVITVIVAFVVSLTVTPLLGVLLFRGRSLEHHDAPIVARAQAMFDRVGRRVVTRPRVAYATFGALALVGLVALPFVRRGDSLVPSFEDRNVLVQWRGAPGTSLAEMSRITARASQELTDLAGIESVGAHVGRAVGGDQIVGTSSGEMWITITARAGYAKTLRAIESVVRGYPGLDSTVLTYPAAQIRRVFGPSSHDLTVRIFGDDFDVLADKGREVAAALGAVKGVRSASALSAPIEPSVEVRVNLDRADTFGIKPGDARRAVTTLVSGLTVGALFEEQKVFDVVVVGTPPTRSSIDSIRDLLIDTPTGRHVRLGDVADVSIAPGLSVIRHEDVSRYVDVIADVSGRSVGDVAADARAAIKAVSFPLQHRAELLDDYARSGRERRGFVAVLVAIAIGILLLLQAAFRSWRAAALACVALPCALAGGIVGALIAGPFSFGSLVGFFVVFAMAARWCLLLVSRYRALEQDEPNAERADLVLAGTREALVPVLLTTIGTLAVLWPFVVLSNRAGHEIGHRLAVVVACGVVSSALFTLLVLPATYLRFVRRARADVTEELALPALVAVGAVALDEEQSVAVGEDQA